MRGQGILISLRTETRPTGIVDQAMESWGEKAEGSEVESNNGKAQ